LQKTLSTFHQVWDDEEAYIKDRTSNPCPLHEEIKQLSASLNLNIPELLKVKRGRNTSLHIDLKSILDQTQAREEAIKRFKELKFGALQAHGPALAKVFQGLDVSSFRRMLV